MKLDLANKADDAFEYVVPLPHQAVDVLRTVYRLSGRFPLLFHSVRSTHQPMSGTTIEVMYAGDGYKASTSRTAAAPAGRRS